MSPMESDVKTAVSISTGVGAFTGVAGALSSQPTFGVLAVLFVGFAFVLSLL